METFLPLLNYAFIMAITPGPNNIMLASSSICFGMKKTLPLALGVQVGFLLLLIICGLWLNALLYYFPGAKLGLKLLGTLYMLYLIWSLQRSLFPQQLEYEPPQRPMSWMMIACFQLVNPKAWLMAMTAVAVFMPDFGAYHWSLMGLGAIFCTVAFMCATVWVALGTGIKRYATHRGWQYGVVSVLVVLIIYSIVSIWID